MSSQGCPSTERRPKCTWFLQTGDSAWRISRAENEKDACLWMESVALRAASATQPRRHLLPLGTLCWRCGPRTPSTRGLHQAQVLHSLLLLIESRLEIPEKNLLQGNLCVQFVCPWNIVVCQEISNQHFYGRCRLQHLVYICIYKPAITKEKM